MTKPIDRDLVCRANGGIYRLSGKTTLRYDGKASCMSKQSVTLLHWFWRPAKTMNVLAIISPRLIYSDQTRIITGYNRSIW